MSIKELRKEKGLTQAELALQLKIDQTTVSKWELNKALPDTAMLITLSDFFNVSIDYLLDRTKYYFPDSLNSETELSNEEHQLIEDYRSLNYSGKKLVKQTVETLRATSAGSGQNKNKIS